MTFNWGDWGCGFTYLEAAFVTDLLLAKLATNAPVKETESGLHTQEANLKINGH